MKQNGDEFIDLIVNNCLICFREEHKKDYENIYKCIKLLRETEDMFKQKDNNRITLFLAASIIKINELFQSSILLFERGLKDYGTVMIRSILELIIKNIAVIRDENVIDTLNYKDFNDYKKTLEFVKSKNLFFLPKDVIDREIENLNKEIENLKNTRSINLKTMAEENNTNEMYSFYKLLCEYTHMSNSVIGKMIEKTTYGYNINGNFKLEDFHEIIGLLLSFLIYYLEILNNEYINDSKLKKEINNYNNILQNYYED